MALTLDTTVGGESANSYASVAEADGYFEARLTFWSTWDALSDQEQIARLIEAAAAIDRLPLQGTPVSTDQALEFPRTDSENLALSQENFDSIPSKVKQAQLEMIMVLAQQRDSSGKRERDVDELDIPGKIGLKFARERSDNNEVFGATMETVRALLRPWLLADNEIRLLM